MKNILIIGADSKIGTEIFNFLEKKYDVIGTSKKKNSKFFFLNLNFPEKKWPIIPTCDVIICCAGITKIKECQKNPIFANKINYIALKKIIKIYKKKNTQLIFFSSTNVFDGSKKLRLDTEKTSAVNVYGKLKIKSENLILKNNGTVLRISKILETTELFEQWLKKISLSKKVKAFQNYSTSLVLLSKFLKIVEYLIINDIRGIIHLSSEDEITYENIAKLIVKNAKKNTKLIIPVKAKKNFLRLNGTHSSLKNSQIIKKKFNVESSRTALNQYLKKIYQDNRVKKKKILIIGSSSNTGQFILNNLDKKKFKIFATFNNTKVVNKFKRNNILFYKLDLTKTADFNRIPTADYIVLLSGVSFSSKKETKTNYQMNNKIYKTNILGIKNFIKYFKKKKIKKIIFFSSISVYGGINKKMTLFKEKTIAQPNDLYGISKLYAEKLLISNFKKTKVICMRLPAIIGIRKSNTLLVRISKKLLKNEDLFLYNKYTSFNSLIHVSDVLNFIIYAINKNFKKSMIINLSSRGFIKFGVLVKILKSLLKSKSKIFYKNNKNSYLVYTNILNKNLKFKTDNIKNSVYKFCDNIKNGNVTVN